MELSSSIGGMAQIKEIRLFLNYQDLAEEVGKAGTMTILVLLVTISVFAKGTANDGGIFIMLDKGYEKYLRMKVKALQESANYRKNIFFRVSHKPKNMIVHHVWHLT